MINLLLESITSGPGIADKWCASLGIQIEAVCVGEEMAKPEEGQQPIAQFS